MTKQKNSFFTQLGASNHTKEERHELDYYATDPIAIREMLKHRAPPSKNIWECSCGEGHLTKELEKHGYILKSTDIMKRADFVEVVDFLKVAKEDNGVFNGSIITNPPYKHASEFVEKAMELLEDKQEIWLFLKIQFLEGKARKKLFKEYPPKEVWVTSSRIQCAKDGDFEKYGKGSAAAYAWFIWEKGFKGNPSLHWFN